VAKDELGTKRECPETGKRFYDLNKDPIVSPYSGKEYPLTFFEGEPAPVVVKERPKPKEKPPEEIKETEEKEETKEAEETVAEDTPEIISLEDAEDEEEAESGSEEEDIPDIPDDDIEVEDDDSDDDDTFLEEEDENDDLSDVISSNVSGKEEET